MPRAINVLGMHRSGTSLTARVLNLLGVDLGTESGITLPGRRENPKGFWERKAIKELNDEILAELGGSWSDPPELEPGWEHDPSLGELRERAARLVAKEFSAAELFGWKDPRSSILLPLWQLVVPDLSYVICLRHPDGVARSLMQRGSPIERPAAHELWLKYTTGALVNTRGSRRQLVFYEDFFEDLDRQVDAIAAFLDLKPKEVKAPVRAKIRSLADPALFRNRTGPDDDARLPPEVRALWVALRAGADTTRNANGTMPFAAGDTEASSRAFVRSLRLRRDGDDALRNEVRELRAVTERAEAVAEELTGTRAKLADTEEQLRAANAMREALEIKLTGTEGKLAGTEGKLFGAEERLRVTLDDLRAGERERESAVEELAQARSQLEAVREEAAGARAEAEAKLHTAEERARSASRKLAAAESRIQAVEAVETELREDLTSIERSVSWRLTKPIRAVKRIASRPRAKRRQRRAGAPAAKDDSAAGGAGPPAGPAGPALHPLEALSHAPPVSIVIPIFNAPAEVRACIGSVLRNTTLRSARLILIDDASTDSEIPVLLSKYVDRKGIHVLRNKRNLGFTATVNRGIRESAACDVVLLNSDTEVGPRWLENLRTAAYSGERTGTATAVSDNAGAFAVPEIGVPNPVPEGLGGDDVARLVAQVSEGRLPETPTGNGFCLYMRRAMIDAVGVFDEEAFPRGYGEENEYSMRAAASGWKHVVDDHTFVHHRREASFGEEKTELSRIGREAIDRLYPSYTGAVRKFVRSPDMAAVRATVAHAFESRASAAPKPRVLFVVHQGGGGAPATNADLMAGLADRFDPFALTSDTETLRLWHPAESAEPVAEWPLEHRWTPAEFTRTDYRAVAWEVLTGHGIELIHVRHLFKHSLDVPRVARLLGIPVVTSFHDFYLSCPTVHLLDEAEVHCGGVCTPGEGTCRFPSPDLASVPPLKHRWIDTWRDEMGDVISGSDALVTTSDSARRTYERSYPDHGLEIEVIEHGRDPGSSADWTPTSPSAEGKVRILVPGNLDVHKGSRLIARLEELDRGHGRLEFHVLGRVDGPVSPGISHGPYRREEFGRRVAAIDPSVAAILSICPETYCHTLTEAWEAGVPVVATDIGALGERIRAHGGGWLVPHSDPEEAYARLLRICADRDGWEEKRREIGLMSPRTVSDMAADYEQLYRRVLDARRSLGAADSRNGNRRGQPPVRAAVFAPGRPGSEPGSTHVRVLRRLTHPNVAGGVSFSRPAASGLVAADVDVIFVQRTGVDPEEADALIANARESATPLVFELDDDLLARTADEGYAPHLASVARLLGAADRVIASTQHLAMVLSEHTDAPVSVVPNAIDERLWFDPYKAEQQGIPDDCLRLLYMGTATHAADLAILRPVLEGLESRGVSAKLEVIGGELSGRGQGWYRRLEVPDGMKVYPRFAGWLREQASRWDIALAPLEDVAFNRSKSDLKLLEYSALGLPSVASEMEAFRGWAGGGPALLVPNETEAWVDAIARLGSDQTARGELARAARRYVRKERCLDSVATDPLARILGEVSAGTARSGAPGRAQAGAGS